ncbi:hypothetical protein [Streptomyces sp. NPDC026673]|uniref:hypothetical protein n=1 Tax=Streptomyces sp. NPDC026673 TaxID=3155724 RepID=UPI0033C86EE6
MTMRLWGKLGAIVPLLAITGCGAFGNEGRACTDIGAESGVSVLFDPEPGTAYRLCVGAVCTEGEGAPIDTSEALLRVRLPDAVGAKKVTVRLTGTPQFSRGIPKPRRLDVSTRVTLRRTQPNGPGCDPVAYQAALRYEPAKGLVNAG